MKILISIFFVLSVSLPVKAQNLIFKNSLQINTQLLTDSNTWVNKTVFNGTYIKDSLVNIYSQQILLNECPNNKKYLTIIHTEGLIIMCYDSTIQLNNERIIICTKITMRRPNGVTEINFIRSGKISINKNKIYFINVVLENSKKI